MKRARINRISIQALVSTGLAFLLTACFMPVPQVPNTASSDTARVPYFTATSSPTASPTTQPTVVSLAGDKTVTNVDPAASPTANVWAIGSPAPTNTALAVPSATVTALMATATLVPTAQTPSPTATPRPLRPSPTATVQAQATYVDVPTVLPSPELPPDFNLKPKAPGGWGAPLLAANEAGLQENTGLFSDEDTYISWAITNEGPSDVTTLFFVDLTLDGMVLERWRNTQLPAGFVGSVPDWQQLMEKAHPTPGSHTLGIVVDPTNLLPESDETDNAYEEDFVWSPSASPAEPTPVPSRLPDLRPLAPDGWDSALIATSYEGDSKIGPLSVDSTSYIKLGLENIGIASVADDVLVHLFLDGMMVRELTWPGLVLGQSVKSSEWSDLLGVVAFDEGVHKLTMVIDPHNAIHESDETNNTLELDLEWASGAVDPRPVYDSYDLLPNPGFMPNLVPGWVFSYDGPIVVSHEKRTGVHSLLTVEQTPYIDLSVVNRSVYDILRSFEVELYFDGFLVNVFEITGGVDASQIVQINDWADLENQTAITPGEHTLKMVIDPYDEVWEENEDDNIYETTLVWEAGDPEAPEPIAYTDEELQAMLSDFKALMDTRDVVVDGNGPQLTEEALRLADAGFYLATGDSLLDTRVDIYLLSHEGYLAWVDDSYVERFAVAKEEDYQSLFNEREKFKRTSGFKGRRFGKVALVVDAENTVSEVMATLAHELGHLRQDTFNPLLSEMEQFYSVNAIQEAQAQQFERVFWLHIEDFIGTPLMRYPDHQGFQRYVDSHVNGWLDEMESDEHNLGFVLQWLVVLDDPNLIHLRAELESSGQLGLESTDELFEYLVSLPSGSLVGYAQERLISLNSHRDAIFDLAKSRLLLGLHPDDEGFGALVTPGLLAP
ncbi:MAG: hypothetical protein O3A33_00275 [Chloroflexi bacterium]|nr:hypothetical protein [Chloroflexota bacterium]